MTLVSKLVLYLVVFACCISIIEVSGSCWSSAWGGCNDGGCRKMGGYCENFGFRPDNNDCRCVPLRGKRFIFDQTPK